MDHILIIKEDMTLECADRGWAKENYNPKKIFEISAIEGMFLDVYNDLRATGDVFNNSTAAQKTYIRANLCVPCEKRALMGVIFKLNEKIEYLSWKLDRNNWLTK